MYVIQTALIHTFIQLGFIQSIFNGRFAKASTVQLQRYTSHRYDGFKIQDAFAANQVTCSSLVVCVMECERQADCRTISWHEGNRKCLLSSKDFTNDSWKYAGAVANSAWVTMIKMDFKVIADVHRPAAVFAAQRSGGVYTLEAAIELCTARQSVVAPPEDVLYSARKGYYNSRCSWASDGTLCYALPDKNYLEKCGMAAPPNVYCTLV